MHISMELASYGILSSDKAFHKVWCVQWESVTIQPTEHLCGLVPMLDEKTWHTVGVPVQTKSV